MRPGRAVDHHLRHGMGPSSAGHVVVVWHGMPPARCTCVTERRLCLLWAAMMVITTSNVRSPSVFGCGDASALITCHCGPQSFVGHACRGL